MSAGAPRPRVAALALAVGLVLADSSIVVLALPDIYRELDTSVAGVTWVLISFNLVMALAAVPAALLARRVGPGRAAAVGLAVFAGAGLACGLADELSTLILARCVQALGGAARGHRGAGAAAGHGRLRAPRHRDLGHAPGRPGRRWDRRSAASSPSWSPGSRSSCSRCRWRSPPRCRSSPSPSTRRRPGSCRPSCAAPAARTWRPTSPWRWSRRRSPRRSSCSSCC